MASNNMISRHSGVDPLVPQPFAAQVIQEMPKASAALNLARRVPMSAKTNRQPVLSVLPEAYWVAGDTGLKDTDKADWENLELVAEELAVIIPIPEAYLADAAVPVWNEVRPLVTEAFGRALDKAVLFGVNKPATWTSQAIIPGAIAAGNKVLPDAASKDIGVDISKMGDQLASQGFSLNQFAARPGFHWALTAARTAQGVPIYGNPDLAAGKPGTLYGLQMHQIENGAWDATQANLVGGDFTKAVIGMRQDITFKVFTEGVITDNTGKVILNLMQQDSVALRVVMRCGYALANPVTAIQRDASKRFPFSVYAPAAAAK